MPKDEGTMTSRIDELLAQNDRLLRFALANQAYEYPPSDIAIDAIDDYQRICDEEVESRRALVDAGDIPAPSFRKS